MHRLRLARAHKKRKHRRMLFEPLERRDLMTTIAWDGGPTGLGTSWHDPLNWEGDVVPGPDDDAEIGPTFAGITIVSNQDHEINSVISHANVTISSGNFVIGDDSTDTSTFHGDFLLGGGNLQGAGTVKLARISTDISG